MLLYCFRPVFHSVTVNGFHLKPEMLPRFIYDAGIYDNNFPFKFRHAAPCSHVVLALVHWQVASMTLKQHTATYCIRACDMEFVSYFISYQTKKQNCILQLFYKSSLCIFYSAGVPTIPSIFPSWALSFQLTLLVPPCTYCASSYCSYSLVN